MPVSVDIPYDAKHGTGLSFKSMQNVYLEYNIIFINKTFLKKS